MSTLSPLFNKNHLEYSAWERNQIICGVDEVGRGCLAGPVVTAAVILPINQAPLFLKDSKIMTSKEREMAAVWIRENCLYSISTVHHRLIDKHNIYQATRIAMKKAILHVLAASTQKPAAIVIDAMPLSLYDTAYNHLPIHHFTQGESKSSSIAAASIIAKVYRDNLMQSYNTIFPGYSFNDHKGYSTKKHKDRIITEQRCLIHRLSFLSFTRTNKKETDEAQQSLC